MERKQYKLTPAQKRAVTELTMSCIKAFEFKLQIDDCLIESVRVQNDFPNHHEISEAAVIGVTLRRDLQRFQKEFYDEVNN